MLNKYKKKIVITFLIILGFFGIALKGYISGSNVVPIGYDPGLYRGIHLAYSGISNDFNLLNLPNRVKHEPLWGIASVNNTIIGGNIDIFLEVYFLIFCIILYSIVFIVSSQKNIHSGVLAFVLINISVIQYEGRRYMYYKQIIGIGIGLIILYLIQKKQTILGILLTIPLIVLHRHTSLYFIATIVLGITIESIINKKINYKLIMLIIISLVIGLILYGPTIGTLLLSNISKLGGPLLGSGYGGVFLEVYQFSEFNIFLIPLSILGAYYQIKNKSNIYLSSGLLIGFLWSYVGFINFRRNLLILDVFVIILASLFIGEQLFSFSNKKIYRGFIKFIVFIIICIHGLVFTGYTMDNASPQITNEEFYSILKIDQLIPKDSYIGNVNSVYTPMIMGYTYRESLSPGLSDLNKRDEYERNYRRQSKINIKCEMLLNSYQNLIKKGLYIRDTNMPNTIKTAPNETIECFKLINKDQGGVLFKIIDQKL